MVPVGSKGVGEQPELRLTAAPLGISGPVHVARRPVSKPGRLRDWD